MSSSKATIKDVAKKAGVSIATVSRFLNNPTSLKDKNCQAVESAVTKLHYQPSIYARRLAGGRLNTFGLIIPGYEGIYYSFYAWEVIRGVALNLDKEKIDLHLHIFWGKDNFNASLVEGVIFADIIGNDKQLRRLIKENTPTVVVNRKITSEEISYVAIDNFKGGYDATEFLIHHGHKKIAHLAGDLRVQAAKERLDGFKSALEKNKMDIKEEYIKIANFSPREAREKLEELFSLREIPSAIFCCSDEVAKEVLNFAEEKRIAIPKDLSVIGFDDNHLLSYGNLMLTTVRQPLLKMAALGVEILKDIVEKKLTQPKKVILEPELVIRDTVSFYKDK